MEPVFFASQEEFRQWLEDNHTTASEILVGFHKVSTGKPSLTWSQSVDQAICFGWIDGIRRSIDGVSYMIRFTPRNPRSVWSEINIRKVEELSRKGLMKPAGMEAFNKRSELRSGIYSYERQNSVFPEDYLTKFQSDQKAWDFFQSMPPSYRKTSTYWVMSAKQESTRIKRFSELMEDCRAGRKFNL